MAHRILAMAHHILACPLGAWRFLFSGAGAWRCLFLGAGEVAHQQKGGRDQYHLCFHG
jgi:hypothetical protein